MGKSDKLRCEKLWTSAPPPPCCCPAVMLPMPYWAPNRDGYSVLPPPPPPEPPSPDDEMTMTNYGRPIWPTFTTFDG